MGSLSDIRTYLIKNNNIDKCYEIIEYLNKPTEDKLQKLIEFKEICNFGIDATSCLEDCLKIFATSPEEYRAKFIFAQNIIWTEIVKCAEIVMENTQKMKKQQVLNYGNDYLKAVEQVEKLCRIYAETQARISELEDILGVDRYLDKISADDLSVLNCLLEEQAEVLNSITSEYRYKFQTQWNLTQIRNILFHKLVTPDFENQICSMLPGMQKRSIVFVVDGFGMCQYLWNKSMWKGNKFLTFKENIFSWLSKEHCMTELVLGSGHVSDTASGLGQIFSGYSGAETGIIASKLSKNGTLYETKKVSSSSFDGVFNISMNSLPKTFDSLGYKSDVFYCSRYDENVSGFSKYLFNGANVISVTPSERVFSLIKDEIIEKQDWNLKFVYITNIDNSGHTVGAFSKFEKYEHQKMNTLFKNFLIELAMDAPELFDGKTSIMLTADHGMAESAKKMISRFDIKNVLEHIGIFNATLIENNRAMLVYGICQSVMETCVLKLVEYFKNKGITVDISCRGTNAYKKLFGDGDKADIIRPDIVLRLIGNGLFYSNRYVNLHLLHYGGHGGYSTVESFVPLLDITLNPILLDKIKKRFLDRM